MRSRTLIIGACAALAGTAASVQAQPAANGPAIPPPVKAMTMLAAAMPSTDFDRSLAFYTKGMGMTATPGGAPTEIMLKFAGGGPNLMLMKSTPANPLPIRAGGSRVTIQVPDMKALAASLAAAGFPLKAPITENAQYHVFVCQTQDPDGNALELIQRGP